MRLARKVTTGARCGYLAIMARPLQLIVARQEASWIENRREIRKRAQTPLFPLRERSERLRIARKEKAREAR